MKENAPEKIYCAPTEGGFYVTTIKPEPPFTDGVEYIRAEAFVEKACEYISEHVEYYMKKDKACNVPLCPLFATKSFIEDFKNYMKGE